MGARESTLSYVTLSYTTYWFPRKGSPYEKVVVVYNEWRRGPRVIGSGKLAYQVLYVLTTWYLLIVLLILITAVGRKLSCFSCFFAADFLASYQVPGTFL